MFPKDNSPRFLTSAELEQAVREHRAQTKRLLAEVRRRRAENPKSHANELPIQPKGQ